MRYNIISFMSKSVIYVLNGMLLLIISILTENMKAELIENLFNYVSEPCLSNKIGPSSNLSTRGSHGKEEFITRRLIDGSKNLDARSLLFELSILV